MSHKECDLFDSCYFLPRCSICIEGIVPLPEMDCHAVRVPPAEMVPPGQERQEMAAVMGLP